jgi:hypothetical protein
VTAIQATALRKSTHVDVLAPGDWEKEPDRVASCVVVDSSVWTASPALAHLLARGIATSSKSMLGTGFHRQPFGAGKSSAGALVTAWRQSGGTWERTTRDVLAVVKCLKSWRSTPHPGLLPRTIEFEAGSAGSQVVWENTPPESVAAVRHLLQRSAVLGTDERDELLHDEWETLLDRLGDAALIALISSLDEMSNSPTSLGESIRIVASLASSHYPGRVQELLEQGLRSRVPVIRYSATLGIAGGDLRKSLSALRLAAKAETISALRRDMEKVIARLQR